MKKLFSIMSNLQTHYHFKLGFQKVDQHTFVVIMQILTNFFHTCKLERGQGALDFSMH